jgi:carboxypeptidase C (cathepsin A)
MLVHLICFQLSAGLVLCALVPSLLNIDDEGYPLQPYGIKENPYSILDVADRFVNPVNTAYSRQQVKTPTTKFFVV